MSDKIFAYRTDDGKIVVDAFPNTLEIDASILDKFKDGFYRREGNILTMTASNIIVRYRVVGERDIEVMPPITIITCTLLDWKPV